MLGKKIGGRYQITAFLGQGSFGTTFLAKDTHLPGTPNCVVKQFTPQNPDPDTVKSAERLFYQEAKILQQLGNKHDQIPQLFAYIEENQEFYLIQEYIEGHDLSEELILNQHMSETEVMQILVGILEILAFVHQHNVIHRDIKPSNIRRRKSDGKIVLIDFGAVKQISTQIANSQIKNQGTLIVGTPGYMPFEQQRGYPKHSSDVYAVGMIAIQALTGLYPHQLEDPYTGKIIWQQQVKINPKLANILDKMVLHEFHQRYQTAGLALQALQELSLSSAATMTAKTLQVSPGNVPTKLVTTIPSKFIFKLTTLVMFAISGLIIGKLILQKADLSIYANSQYRIKIQYPQNWERQEIDNQITAEIVTFLSNKQSEKDNFIEKVTISVENFSGTLEESSKLFRNDIKSNLSASQIIEESSTTLLNKPAMKLVYTGKDGNKVLKNLQIWTLKNEQAYIITYTAKIDDYDKFKPIVDRMIKSFEINSSVK
ncbi:serine/threonine protein kinase [Tolypothrix sp. FACHB-123]|uniref:serine/threonine-protein kinase n=1 Tax=Tolypothrix sp. FACHB-123 TaxID=2692868 RepID=UPI001683CADF|nr:serine/threonine-protein kinase [Tolypothrix sp. FACHB-123]MBD2355633.1 serine/threonine protein kinase [Tolypothrix sp. FACHB-123]